MALPFAEFDFGSSLLDKHSRIAGLGEVAARRLIQTPNTRLLLGARHAGPRGARTLSLDLMSLQNVRTFVSALDAELGSAQIDALVLNAGALFPDDKTRSADGFEAAFAVNHLAHFLLLRLLLLRLAYGATVILTTSSTHDPAEKTRPPPGRIYAALRSGIITWPEPSELALRDDLRDALWRDSSVLVGLPSAD